MGSYAPVSVGQEGTVNGRVFLGFTIGRGDGTSSNGTSCCRIGCWWRRWRRRRGRRRAVCYCCWILSVGTHLLLIVVIIVIHRKREWTRHLLPFQRSFVFPPRRSFFFFFPLPFFSLSDDITHQLTGLAKVLGSYQSLEIGRWEVSQNKRRKKVYNFPANITFTSYLQSFSETLVLRRHLPH